MRFNFNQLSPEVDLDLAPPSQTCNKSEGFSAKKEIIDIHFCRRFIPQMLNLQPDIYIAFTLTALNLHVTKLISA